MIQPNPPASQSAPQPERLLNAGDRRSALVLTTLTLLFAAGFVLAPKAVLGAGPTHGQSMSAATSEAFTAYWQAGRREYPTALAELVAYWRSYHLAKAVFALALTIVLCWLAYVIWRSLLRAARLRPLATTASVLSGTVVSALALGSMLVVIANIQGIFAPFSSLVSLLPLRHRAPALSSAEDQIRHALGTPRAIRHAPAALKAMIDDFQWYHAVLVAQAAVLAIILAALAVQVWRRTPLARRPTFGTKILSRLLASGCALCALVLLAICAANISTTLNPAPALRLALGP